MICGRSPSWSHTATSHVQKWSNNLRISAMSKQAEGSSLNECMMGLLTRKEEGSVHWCSCGKENTARERTLVSGSPSRIFVVGRYTRYNNPSIN